jgi:hypothetical protein
MGVVKRFKLWRRLRGHTFDEASLELGAQARVDAAAYELQSIVRDLTLVRLPNPVGVTRAPTTAPN